MSNTNSAPETEEQQEAPAKMEVDTVPPFPRAVAKGGRITDPVIREQLEQALLEGRAEEREYAGRIEP